MKHDCNEHKKYSEQYDAYFCIECNKWLESNCDDPNCEFCYNRPNKPSEVNDGKERTN
jgi:hypothetical protein